MLSCGRRVGFGAVGYIPLTEIESYLRLFSTDEDFEYFTDCIRAMDAIYVASVNRKLKPASKPANG